MRRVILAIVSTAAALVLLLSFKSHSPAGVASPAAAVSSTGTSTSNSSSGSDAGTGSSPTTTAKRTAKTHVSATKTVTGDAADTQYGPVQVQITVKDGKVTTAKATEYPAQDPRDAQINYYAIPVLNQEAAQAGSASIDMVSGATYTSEGYIQSLQSALDKAGL
ncbi:MAG TPA: FMN-binding protein [Mycobacteriales bacterium]|jgi:uncharacterized protein with FMN-binding domain|nr:FMN-binding protein [Mycobacteriales bacterium]